MHRHGYKGRKLGREKDQRRALIKGLADSLILHGKLSTTHAKAKEVIPYAEKLITKAKNPTLANRRLIISRLNTLEASNKLVDEIAPKLKSRSSGHLRLIKGDPRRGDNSPMSAVSFVDDLSQNVPKEPVAVKKSKPAIKNSASTKKPQKTTTPKAKAAKK